jgi:NAD(P)-dependent dehydrogenase (short-subunit alcohol dehydrogenase family)
MIDVALVTGGTGSIGREICDRLEANGFAVLAADPVKIDEAATGRPWIELDVRSISSIARAINEAQSLGSLKALVNAHGILHETKVMDIADDVMQRITDVNLQGVARMCSAVSKIIVDGGAIVNLSSVTASMGRTQNSLIYQATKAGVESITRSFAVALAHREIRVNCVAPGYLSEPMRGDGRVLRALQGGNDALKSFTPFGRLITPNEVAHVVAFLCSSGASGISGVVLPVDGAQRAY